MERYSIRPNSSGGKIKNKNKITNNNILKKPVFLTLSIIMIFVFVVVNSIKHVPCGKGILRNTARNFTHQDFYHIASNLITFYLLSDIETIYGSKAFLFLIFQILILCILIEQVISKYTHINCTIGFSSILFGIVSWELIYVNNGIDIYVIYSLLCIVILPSITNKKASLFGHVIGLVSGVVVSLYYKPNQKN